MYNNKRICRKVFIFLFFYYFCRKRIKKMSNIQHKIALVIVLFHPDNEDIAYLLRLSTLYHGTIIDNTENNIFNAEYVNKMRYIGLGENKGIAEAQNIGIKTILKNNQIQYIIFLDQDSRIENGYPIRITDEFYKFYSSGINLSTLGPVIINKKNGETYKSVIHKNNYINEDFILKKHIISSGSCISRKALEDVGLYESPLFIDFVDDEWCWRANAKGYVCGITKNLSLEHRIGQREIHLGKYIISISAPQRYYYQYRNYLWLIRRKYVPRQWKMAYGVKFAARFLYFPFLIKGGGKCWKFMARGILDGIRGIHSKIKK